MLRYMGCDLSNTPHRGRVVYSKVFHTLLVACKKKPNSSFKVYWKHKQGVAGIEKIALTFYRGIQLFYTFISPPADTWSTQATTGEQPPPLNGHSLTMIDQQRAVLFGGRGAHHCHNDTYVLDMEAWV